MTTGHATRGDHDDARAIEKGVENASKKNLRVSQLVIELAKSDPFQKREGREDAR